MRLPFKVVSDIELMGVRALYGVGSENSLKVGDSCEAELDDNVIQITVKEIGMRKMELVEAGIDAIAVEVRPKGAPPLKDCVLHFLPAEER